MNIPANSEAIKLARPVMPKKLTVVAVKILALNRPGAKVATKSRASASKNPPSETSSAMVHKLRVIGSRSSRAVSLSEAVTARVESPSSRTLADGAYAASPEVGRLAIWTLPFVDLALSSPVPASRRTRDR